MRSRPCRCRALQPVSQGQPADPGLAAGAQQLPPGQPDLRADLRRHRAAAVPVAHQLGGQHVVDHREPVRPGRRGPQPFADLPGQRADDRAARHVDAGQFPGGQPEQRPGAERAQRDLDAGLPAVVGDHGRAGMQPAGQRVERARVLCRVRVRGHGQRLVQGEDQRQPGRRHAPVHGGLDPGLPVAAVPGDERAQRGRGPHPHRLVHRLHRAIVARRADIPEVSAAQRGRTWSGISASQIKVGADGRGPDPARPAAGPRSVDSHARWARTGQPPGAHSC